MKVVAITVAYCPAVALARSLQVNKNIDADERYIIQGHYPINRKKNNNDIKLIAEAFSATLLDPGKDLGSAQSQNWCLSQIGLGDKDWFINLDPDSCGPVGWDGAAESVLRQEEDCVLISCMAPMIERYGPQFEIKEVMPPGRIGIPKRPTPFNLSMWRYSFIKEIGGIPQLGLWWGETEGAFYQHCQMRRKYHAYLLDYMENEDGKFMQDRQHNEYKDRHMRTMGDKQFLGSFEEFLKLEYPQLLEIDTCKDLSDSNHR